MIWLLVESAPSRNKGDTPPPTTKIPEQGWEFYDKVC